jgi:hypothetical protein
MVVVHESLTDFKYGEPNIYRLAKLYDFIFHRNGGQVIVISDGVFESGFVN